MFVVLSSCGTQQNIEDFKYDELEDGTLVITDYQGKATSIVVPDTIDGKTVTHIGKGCFDLSSPVTRVVIPASIIAIDDGAFDCATKLDHLVIKGKTISIGKHGFTSSGLSTVEIESEEIYIGEEAFALCIELTTLNLANAKIIKIGSKAFLGSSIKKLELNADEIDIGNQAFCSCGNLKTISLKSVKVTLREETFQLCIDISEVTIDSKDENIPLKNVSIGKKCFSCCDLTFFSISSGEVTIGDEAFYNNGKLTEIQVPKGTMYGLDVFKACYANPVVTFVD